MVTPFERTRPVPADHPAFAGHFPGQPLLPGVALLAEVLEAAREAAHEGPALAEALSGPLTLNAAKFLSPVRPGSALRIRFTPAATALDFEVHCGDVLAAKGQWTWTPAG